MPSKDTFTIKPIRELLAEEMTPGTWIDGMAGLYSPAKIRNDLNPEIPVEFHIDAMAFFKQFSGHSVDGVLFDPPYSPRQVSECYKKYGIKVNQETTNAKFYSDLKDMIASITRPGGKVISFGWNSMGMGKNRGFEITRILLVPHGGVHNDTICTVELQSDALPGLKAKPAGGASRRDDG